MGLIAPCAWKSNTLFTAYVPFATLFLVDHPGVEVIVISVKQDRIYRQLFLLDPMATSNDKVQQGIITCSVSYFVELTTSYLHLTSLSQTWLFFENMFISFVELLNLPKGNEIDGLIVADAAVKRLNLTYLDYFIFRLCLYILYF